MARKTQFQLVDNFYLQNAILGGESPFSNPVFKQAKIPASIATIVFPYGTANKAIIPLSLKTKFIAGGISAPRIPIFEFKNENGNDIFLQDFAVFGVADGNTLTMNMERTPILNTSTLPYSTTTNAYVSSSNYTTKNSPTVPGTDKFWYGAIPLLQPQKGICTLILSAENFVAGDSWTDGTITWIEFDTNT